MFSSLSQYNPKTLLAGYLSRSLAAFFDVDPASVEANLMSDARVVLNDIVIKEKDVGDGRRDHLRVSGGIRQIEFSWAWDGTELMKDVRLTVRGVKIAVRLVGGDEQVEGLGGGDDMGDDDANASKEDASDDQPPSDWKARYLQQIVDHLTLAITDVTVAIHIDDKSQVVLQSKGMELVTLKREGDKEENSAGLRQTMTLGSIEAWIERGDGSKSPILEPFGYKANITRISGRRFLDGVLSGLLVEGASSRDSSSHASSTIRLHAGIRQVQGLNSLQRVLLLLGQDGRGEPTDPSDGTGGAATRPNGSYDVDASRTGTETKSIFHLPFRSMEVVLENWTNLRLAGCNVRYCTDGSELSVDCCGGLWVDGAALSVDSR